MRNWDEEKLEFEKIEEQGKRKLEAEIQSTMELQKRLHDFLNLWTNEIGKENISKIFKRRIK